MSADNAIVVKKRGNQWFVWMGFLSDDYLHVVPEHAEVYPSRSSALEAAHDWYHRECVVEYGVMELSDEEGGTAIRSREGKDGNTTDRTK